MYSLRVVARRDHVTPTSIHDCTIRDVHLEGDTIIYGDVVPDNNASFYLHVPAQHNVVAQDSVRLDFGVVADLHSVSDNSTGSPGPGSTRFDLPTMPLRLNAFHSPDVAVVYKNNRLP